MDKSHRHTRRLYRDGLTACLALALIITGCGWIPGSTQQATVTGSDGVDQGPGDVTSDGDNTDGDLTSDGESPDNAYCSAVNDWDAAWMAFEEQVLELVNRRRAEGADCGTTGTFDPAEPLAMDPALRCAARNHSMDMGLRGYFDHDTPEGLGPGDRLDQAAYSGSTWGENIAWGYATPEAVVTGWMTSPGHCANIMRGRFTQIGIGYYDGSLWTQTFGRP